MQVEMLYDETRRGETQLLVGRNKQGCDEGF
jgi:hypothetical protein